MKSRLYNLKLEEGGSIAEFLKEVKDISNQLIAIGETVSNDEIVEHVLNALPESYGHFVSSIGLRNRLPDVTTLTGLYFMMRLGRNFVEVDVWPSRRIWLVVRGASTRAKESAKRIAPVRGPALALPQQIMECPNSPVIGVSRTRISCGTVQIFLRNCACALMTTRRSPVL